MGLLGWWADCKVTGVTQETSAEHAVCKVAPGPLPCALITAGPREGSPAGGVCGDTLHRSLHYLVPRTSPHQPPNNNQQGFSLQLNRAAVHLSFVSKAHN